MSLAEAPPTRQNPVVEASNAATDRRRFESSHYPAKSNQFRKTTEKATQTRGKRWGDASLVRSQDSLSLAGGDVFLNVLWREKLLQSFSNSPAVFQRHDFWNPLPQIGPLIHSLHPIHQRHVEFGPTALGVSVYSKTISLLKSVLVQCSLRYGQNVADWWAES